jgi:hypothetical protein
LGLKITATVSSFEPQNQVGFGLPVVPQNRWEGDDVIHTPKSTGLLRVEASLARLSQSSLKTGRDMMAGGARGTVPEVVSESS